MIMFALALQGAAVPMAPPPGAANYDISCVVHTADGKSAKLDGTVRQAASSTDDWDTSFSLKSADKWLPSAEDRTFTKLRTLTAATDASGHRYVWWLFLPPDSASENTYIALSDYVSGNATSKYVATGLCDLKKVELAK
jgi:hypothetical protein